jgi:protein-S-isoprenylcysteine O-methyltransferase Ste14
MLPPPGTPRLLNAADRWEKILFLAFFGYFLLAFSLSFARQPNLINALYLADQTIIMLFLLLRRHARRISERPGDYLIAAAGTLLPLLALPSSGENVAPPALCAGLMLGGIAIHLGAKLSLRRSFGIVAADRGIKAHGLYRFVRHPMYLGYMLVHAALVLSGPLAWNIAVFAGCWLSIFLRIAAEERLLCQNEAYRAFQRQTRFRLVPGLY